MAHSTNDKDIFCTRSTTETQLLTSSSNSSTKSAKMFVNYKQMFAGGPTANKEQSPHTIPPPTLYQKYVRMYSTHNARVWANDGVSTNSVDNNDSWYHRSVRLSGGTHHQTADKLNLYSSECKLQSDGLKFVDPTNPVNVINLQLNAGKMKTSVDGVMLPPRRRVIKSRTRATQTLYRESSAQTLPYLPGVSNSPEELENLELFKLPTILPGDGPPGLYEVEVLERSRKRWAFAKALKENFRRHFEAAKKQPKLQEHGHILDAFEWEHWIEREEYIQECQMLRFELLIRMFDKRDNEMHMASKTRIQKSCEEIEAKRKLALRKNEIEYNRELRRLEIKRAKQPRVWRKQHISQELGDPTSEFYAPKMRYGVNPSRRHFTASRKAFDMRMDDLERKAFEMDPKSLKCPFAKLKEWSKPKGVLQEVEQNFCSDANLKKLYESLRTLRETSKRQKYTPICLKAKEPVKTTFVEEKQFNQDPQANAGMPDNYILVKQKSCEDSVCSSSADMNGENSLEDLELGESFEELRKQKQAEHLNMKLLQNEMRCEELETLIGSYEGNAIGWLMRFLSEEMCRLKEQRKLHFFTMMAKRERWKREAAEAGLRQKENYMRDVYENLYKECDKANKEITDKFLNSILSTDLKDYAHQHAERDVVLIARELDKEISGWLESFREVQSPLNYHTLRHALKDIVMPDVQKIMYRLETDNCIHYIINDVVLCEVYRNLEAYDVSFSLANDLVDGLVDNDLYLSSPSCSSEFCCCTRAQEEAKAIMRKVIRYAVPGRRWHTEEERVAIENINDLLDDMFDKVTTNNCFGDADMTNPPDIPQQRSHIDLINYKNDMACVLEDSKSSEHYDSGKYKIVDHGHESARTDVTKILKNTERFLLVDPDTLPNNDVLINKNDYVFPESKPELRVVHSVDSTYDLSRMSEFHITSHISSEEILNIPQSGGEDISIDEITPRLVSEPSHGTKADLTSYCEDCTEQLYGEELNEDNEEIDMEEMKDEDMKDFEHFVQDPVDNEHYEDYTEELYSGEEDYEDKEHDVEVGGLKEFENLVQEPFLNNENFIDDSLESIEKSD